MSEEPRCAAVREFVRLYNEDRQSWLRALPEEVVIATDPGWPDGGEFVGRDAAADFVRKFEEAWASVRLRIDGIEELGGAVVTPATWLVRGTTSGIETEMTFSVAWGFDEDDRLVSGHFYLDHEAARERALGSRVRSR